MRGKIGIVLISLLLTLSVAYGEKIKIPKIVIVKSETVHLGDIAKIEGKEGLKDIELADAPSPGSYLELTREYIRARVEQSGIKNITLNIPERIRIIRESVTVSKGEIEKIAKNFILANNPWRENAQIVELKATRSVVLPKGSLSYQCLPPRRFIGSFTLPIVFRVNGKIADRVLVMAKVKARVPVVVSSYPLRRGEVITREKVRVETRELTHVRAGLFTNINEVLGKRMKRTIGANVILHRGLIEIPPLIKRGTRITIMASSQGLIVTAPGQAKENGHLGEMIKVINLLSKRIIYGQVIDEKTVRVDF